MSRYFPTAAPTRDLSLEPTTVSPSTLAPTTEAPSTAAPTTATPTTIAPTTIKPTTAAPTTIAPTTIAPTTIAPTTLAPSTLSPSTTPPAPTHHHHSKAREIEIDSTAVIGFVLVCLLALLYRKRRKLPGYLLQIKYYLCCCRLSDQEILDQQEEHATLNDFIFDVEDNEETGRLNASHYSELTEDQHTELLPRLPLEVSIQSVFPDLLGDEMEKQPPNNQNNHNNSLEDPLIPPRQNAA
ncbi:Glycosyl hydrolase family 92 [Seminavis robusta]|uniref:Glycosyl hydrolase family 92 n=1 Tax=Seminavis robusta TaxID=568900 RepID=A0A9N8HI97_9STRA|nr:Glycosyl hydrolase family 92 [Seminavis robusta]|eukprot:Sro686_g187070.1 Glycosyl hydrolase family 92 (240) ;mRNA; f:19154-19995